MASINGIGLKNVRTVLKAHGKSVSKGIVTYLGNDLGVWEHGEGAEHDRYGFDEHLLDKEVDDFMASEYAAAADAEKPATDTFMSSLLKLYNIERSADKSFRMGHRTYVVASSRHYYHGYASPEPKQVVMNTKFTKDFINKMERFYNDGEMTVRAYDRNTSFDVIAVPTFTPEEILSAVDAYT
jgi:hypothetical protein